ncbi:MAG: dihydropteroate synthase [Lentisphaeria bacterium]|nr:dihydropteroate synthase [Lentisphaeria bacterium]
MFDLTGFLKNTPSPKIMGIVNTTAESFSREHCPTADSALARGLAHLDCGADLLDIGGESTRPGAKECSGDLEMNRVLPVVRNLLKVHPELVISVDTRHKEVAKAALLAGAKIINDVSMLRHSPEIADLVAENGAALILSHSRGTPENMNDPEYCTYPAGVARMVADELAAAREKACAAGVKKSNILLDPGFGFAKTPEQNWELIEEVEKIDDPGNLLVGVSRKSFLGFLTGESDPARRGGETLALELIMAVRKIGMIRTHAVRELHNALMVMRKTGVL